MFFVVFINFIYSNNSFCVYVNSSDLLGEEEDDTIHMGNAIMTFYSALIDLLGRCAPEMHVSDNRLHT